MLGIEKRNEDKAPTTLAGWGGQPPPQLLSPCGHVVTIESLKVFVGPKQPSKGWGGEVGKR